MDFSGYQHPSDIILLAVRYYVSFKLSYRTVDKFGNVVDFYLSKERDEKTAQTFLCKSIKTNGLPEEVVIDKSGTNALALHNMNVILWLTVVLMLNLIEVVDVKYLNNIVEQSYRPIKQKMVQALGWQS